MLLGELLGFHLLNHAASGDHPLWVAPVEAEPVEQLQWEWIVLAGHHELALHVEVVEHCLDCKSPLHPAQSVCKTEAQLQQLYLVTVIKLELAILPAR